MGARIVIVDDDAKVGEELRSLLIEYGHIVLATLSDSVQALVLIRILHPEVVVTDLRMPGMSGMQLLAYVRQLPQPPAVVMVSAYDDHSLQSEAREAGAHDYVIKGASGEQVNRAVAAAAASRRSLADPPSRW